MKNMLPDSLPSYGRGNPSRQAFEHSHPARIVRLLARPRAPRRFSCLENSLPYSSRSLVSSGKHHAHFNTIVLLSDRQAPAALRCMPLLSIGGDTGSCTNGRVHCWFASQRPVGLSSMKWAWSMRTRHRRRLSKAVSFHQRIMHTRNG